ncbi:hypothetical protein SASPL_119048 [Salvia splendens]|uniref:Uncharacterized protein n=1 Tax=Salvia splendens TaxID=180675 RepID=A0A8X8Y3G9_SALSN|nr:hypothetical protein SASPL_119048 [Salvia splendens]
MVRAKRKIAAMTERMAHGLVKDISPFSYLLVHLLKAALGVERDVLRQRVEQLGDGLVTAERVLYDAARVEEADVHRAVDDVVHEKNIRGEVVARSDVEALERDEVEVEGLERVVHDDQGEPQHPATERDVLEAPGLAPLDADPGFVQLRGRADDVVTALVGGGRGPRLLLLGARLLEKKAPAVYVKDVEAVVELVEVGVIDVLLEEF